MRARWLAALMVFFPLMAWSQPEIVHVPGDIEVEGFSMTTYHSQSGLLYVRTNVTNDPSGGCDDAPYCYFHNYPITFGEDVNGDDAVMITGGANWNLNIKSCAIAATPSLSRRQRCFAAHWRPGLTGVRQDFMCHIGMGLNYDSNFYTIQGQTFNAPFYQFWLYQGEFNVSKSNDSGTSVTTVQSATNSACGLTADTCDTISVAGTDAFRLAQPGDAIMLANGMGDSRGLVEIKTVVDADTVALSDEALFSNVSALTTGMLHLLHYVGDTASNESTNGGCSAHPCSYAEGLGNIVGGGGNQVISYFKPRNVCIDVFSNDGEDPAVSCPNGPSGVEDTTSVDNGWCDATCNPVPLDQRLYMESTFLFQAGRKYDDPTSGAWTDDHYLNMFALLGYHGNDVDQDAFQIRVEYQNMSCWPVKTEQKEPVTSGKAG